MQYKEIPRKLIVAKRLAQCLNPALPNGVHQRALDVYAHVLAVLGVCNTFPLRLKDPILNISPPSLTASNATSSSGPPASSPSSNTQPHPSNPPS